MIDLETLNVGVSAPLFEIGVCFFDVPGREIVSSLQWDVDLLDVILTTGFMPSKDTVQWWQKQDYNSRCRPWVPLALALSELSDQMRKHKVEKVWANSPSFDCVLLQRHYEACNIPVPWRYSQELDFRTMCWMDKRTHKPETNHVSHNAREDAVAQTKILFLIMDGMNNVETD